MLERVYTEHLKGRKVLLRTPSGFAVFLVQEFALKEDKNIWVYFSDPDSAIQVLFALGFIKADNRSVAANGDDGPGKDIIQLIKKFCKTGEELFVEDNDLKASIEKKLKITCICDGYTVGELMWGIKNVLHEFIHEERRNITPEYCLPLSQGLQEALQYYLINIPTRMLDKCFVSKFGFLCYLDMNLEIIPKELLRTFDKYVGIGETIQDGLDYAKLLAMVLVPELVEERGFSKTFSLELALKLEEAKMFHAQHRDDLTMHDIQNIMGSLDYLLNVPGLRDEILMRVKHMEAIHFQSQAQQLINESRAARGLEAIERVYAWEQVNFDHLEFRRTLLETPSGFAIFNVCKDVFINPERTWTYFSDTSDAHNIVCALGFVSVDDKSVARDRVTGPSDNLRQLILRFCKDNEELVVQDAELQAVIESKLGVRCWTGAEVVDELIWGLKYVLHDFILEEKDKLTADYYYPLSKGLQKDFKRYDVPLSKINRDFIYSIGYLHTMDVFIKTASKALHDEFDPYVSGIAESIEDDLIYARVIAKVLVPEFEHEIDLAELAGDLGSKLMDLPKDAGKAIASHDKQHIQKSLERFLGFCKERRRALEFLKDQMRENRTIEDQIGVTGRLPVVKMINS